MEAMSEKMNKQPAAPARVLHGEEAPADLRSLFCVPPLHTDVQVVIQWTLINAFMAAVPAVAYYILFIVTGHPSRQASSWQETLNCGLVIGVLWCSTPQAAAGTMALLLPCHRWRLRRVAAYAALAVTVASHCMLAGVVVVIMVSMDPRDHLDLLLFVMIFGSAAIFMCAVCDLHAFLVLLRGEWACMDLSTSST